MSSAANRNTRYCACTKYRVFLLADRANARTSRKPKVFEMHCERKHCGFASVSVIGRMPVHRESRRLSKMHCERKHCGFASVSVIGRMPVHRENRRFSRCTAKESAADLHCVFVKRVSDLGVTEMKRVLFVTSEAVPFIKTGGLADVAGSLPKYFLKNEYEVSVMLPKYMCIREDMRKKMHHILHFYVDLGWRKQYVGILEAKEDGIQYYFIDNEFYFAGDRPYNNIYEDVEKFAFFSKAVLEALPHMNYQPDIIHCHDWQTGLVPVYLENIYKKNVFYQNMKTVFTIHNLQFQGRWNLKAVKDITGLPDALFAPDKLESYGEGNYLKGGIVYADAVTTVSPTYAYEITTPDGGEGLDGLIRSNSYKLSGIINGIDYNEYNPKADPKIAYLYDANDLEEGKRKNKQVLLKDMNLPYSDDVMLVGIVSRMTEQKGFALVDYMMDELLSSGKFEIVALGTGEERYENMFRYYESRYPDRLKANIMYSEEAAHRIYAASDAFLMPSLFEPCGLSQLMSLRYGTVPVVRETGGLKDTVEPYNEYQHTGTGFTFSNYNAHEMRDSLLYAYQVFHENRTGWLDIARRGMEQNFSWSSSAKEYEKLYARL